MGFSVSSSVGKSAGKVLMAAFLASAATGCSSDSSRFGGLFSGTDNLTTSSIPRRNLSGLDGDPVPSQDVASAGQVQQDYSGQGSAMNQSYPNAPAPRYNPSAARAASAPAVVQRAELAAPTASSAPVAVSTQRAALAEPQPAVKKMLSAPAAQRLAPAGLQASAEKTANGWTTANAPSVTLRPGESIDTLARRYGVPAKEILRANELKTVNSAEPGRRIIIPTMNGASAAKVASAATDLSKGGQLPAPAKGQDQNSAMLPSGNSLRDKSQSDQSAGKIASGAGKGRLPGGGTYVVKPGDSLAKIAKATGANIDDLKASNDFGKGGIRVGQTLNLPHGATAPAADPVKTASIVSQKPVVKAVAEPVQTVSAPAQAAVVATQSVDDAAEKSDVASVAPEATGIGKYRWPVRGAVVAGYGANVEGSRNDGIDISVPQGTPIKAAENGVVIYAGNGLKELGNTVLVRHDDGTVTVYGHADALSVARGQKVQRGQTLATSGMSGNAKSPQVHFEVRKNASPVNPMTFLE
jgi:murein DD-endopeptidase MepM/ murein hydrolase activator NlpD